MNNENKEIRTIQEVELNILKHCLEVIKKNHLRYFMLGGTLLGAIRHNGFIPWDDDIDIGMPRKDYEIFLDKAKQELMEPFCIEYYIPGVDYHQQYFAKVTDKRVKVRLLNTDTKLEVPVWVDIFPLDGVPEGKINRILWEKWGMFLAKLFTISQSKYLFDRHSAINRSRGKAYFGIKVIQKTGLDRLLNRDLIWKKLDRHLKRYEYDTSSSLINFCGHWHMKELFRKEVYGEGANYLFEDIQMRGPEDYDFVLRQMYGDYMVPPPEGKKFQHGLELINCDS